MINRIVVVGRLTHDPEARQTSSGISYARFSIATKRYGSKDNTDFIPVVVWRHQADYVAKYIKKGYLVSIEGSLTSSRYKNKNNEDVTRYEVNADRISSLETRKSLSNTGNTSTYSTSEYIDKDMTFSKENKKSITKNKNEDNDIPWDIEL